MDGTNAVSNKTKMLTLVNTSTQSLIFEIIDAQQYNFLNEIIAIVTATIAVFGLVANSLNVKTFIAMGIHDGVSVTFLTLSLADFCYTTVTLIQAISALVESMEHKHDLSFYIDPFAVMFFSANVGVTIYIVTILTTTYLATVRCLCIARPLHFKNMFTKNTSIVASVAFSIIAVISQTPVFAHMGMTLVIDAKTNSTKMVLWLSEEREKIKDIVRVMFDTYLSLASQIVVVICLIVMTMALLKSAKFRQRQGTEKINNSSSDGENDKDRATRLSGKELSVVNQVLFISIIYIVCSVCKMFTAFSTLLNPKFDMGRPHQFVYLILSSSRTAFDCINSSVNFCVYIVFNSRFRQTCMPCLEKWKN